MAALTFFTFGIRGAMPTETAIVITGIVLVFVVFAAALGWAAFYTRNVRTPGATYFDAADSRK